MKKVAILGSQDGNNLEAIIKYFTSLLFILFITFLQ